MKICEHALSCMPASAYQERGSEQLVVQTDRTDLHLKTYLQQDREPDAKFR